MDNFCEVCEEFFYDDKKQCWIMRIQNRNWNDYLDDYDYTDIPVKYCYECGRKLD